MKFKNLFQRSLLILGILIFSNLVPKAQTLSNQAEISLLTCSPGEELYSLFGHSAIRVKDPKKNMDWVFNYGTFNFRTPNFYMKFARGKLNYMLSVTQFNRFKRTYIAENRSIIEQKLNLDSLSRQELFIALIDNAQEANKYYKYDFLFDNCSTRVRDIVEKNPNSPVAFNSQLQNSAKTFWNLLDPYMEDSRWIYLGIHLALGQPCDQKATPYQYMFLPDHMMNAFAIAKIKQNDTLIPLAQKPVVLYNAQPISNPTKWYQRPLVLFSCLALLLLWLTVRMIRKKKAIFWPDTLLFGFIGLLGWFIFFLWFLTDHLATGPNWSIFWAFPLHFPISLLLLRKKRKTWIRYYFLTHFVVLILIIGAWPILPQTFPVAILPILAIMTLRCLFIFKKYQPTLS
ncbi:MAG: DUF4105 domain-containing protein [Marinifilaceae bacterium]